MTPDDIRRALLERLTHQQREAVTSTARRLLIIAGAGSGKTEVMARRIAWWVAVEGVPRDQIVAFTFTEKAAEEMKFRIRRWIGVVTPEDESATLGRMFVGTIHGFCLRMLQELLSEVYGVFDILDETGRLAMVQRWFHGALGLRALKTALGDGQFETIRKFLLGYDLLNECGIFQAEGPDGPRPTIGEGEREWIQEWRLTTSVDSDAVSEAFAVSAARYYGALQARRLLDFSTAQSELVNVLKDWEEGRAGLAERYTHVVVDEFQDVNIVQDQLIRLLLGNLGTLTAVGDHRQAIYGWRGGRVRIMADWQAELAGAEDGDVLDLPDNFRSTERIIDLANQWSDTISRLGTLPSPHMTRGNPHRMDYSGTHVAFRRFGNRAGEAAWIGSTVERLVDSPRGMGVRHDVDGDRDRGLGYADIAILVRSATDVRTYMEGLERLGIPSVVRAGPDLFRQPETILLLSAMCIAGDVDQFFAGRPPSMASIAGDMGVAPEPEPMLREAGALLEAAGIAVTSADLDRLVAAANGVRARLKEESIPRSHLAGIRTPALKKWLGSTRPLRRIYPQTIFQWLAAEGGVQAWDAQSAARANTAMFHLGQLAGLIKGIETPGWVTPRDLKWQMIALTHWGSRNARPEEAPLLVAPDAVTISTVHAAKGLEFPVVFLADVAAQRFPARLARSVPSLPFSGPALDAIDPAALADNDNYDAERRLMYVALTRAERYLFISSGSANRSRFERELGPIVTTVGGELNPPAEPDLPELLTTESEPAFRLVTSFSDFRYYIECPHDYYLRKVLGFAPTIDQAFGYGRGVHNLMRAIHLDPTRFADLADTPDALSDAIQTLIDEGLFYLRYTVGDPLENMKSKAKEIVGEYVNHYRTELSELEFEPEQSFETLVEEAGVLVSGAIDVIRHDDPPRVSLIDFKSGDPDNEHGNASALDRELMKLQVTVYGLAAKKELEYEPDLGIVRYLGVEPGSPTEERELQVALDQEALDAARETVVEIAGGIQRRVWDIGPQRPPKKPGHTVRCEECDFILLCGRDEAIAARDM